MGQAADVDWDALVRAHRRRVLVSVLALGLPLAAAEDVVQDAWARLYERWQAGALDRIEMPGLAITQARFLALDALRRRPPAAPDPAAGTPADEVLLHKHDLERALAVLETASPAARAIIVAITDDPPRRHDDIARQLGLSTQRVRQILWETRKLLRDAWSKGTTP